MSAPSEGTKLTTTPVAGAGPAAGETAEGRTVGPYLIGRRLGEGGMGTVYLAEHTVIGRKAAIKLLNSEVSTDADAVSRFFTEARAVNQIRHPNIVEVTDFGTADGRHYIVMEYLEGETLAGRLDRAGLLPEEAVSHIGRQVASALGAAHEQGMVHRDLKPANIFLRQHPDYPDFVKVLDFGIAKLLAPGAALGHQTRVGTVMGTPSYMSPEQCLGEADLDHRSDIYSLGVVLYGMLTGQLPFRDAGLGQMIVAHVTETPRPPHEVNKRVSRGMSALVLKAMAKRREHRFATMKEMRQALEALSGAPRTPTPMGVPIMLMMGDSGPLPAPAAAERLPRPPDSPTILTEPPRIGLATPTKDEALVERLVFIVKERVAARKLTIPPLSPVVAACLSALHAPDFSLDKIALMAGQSATLSSALVRLANGPSFPKLSPALSLQQAVTRLGKQGLEQALVEMEARPVLELRGTDPRVKGAFRRPWEHALATALLCERLCGVLEEPDRALAHPLYLAGLVHDIGRPLVASFLVGVERQTAGSRGPRWMNDTMWLNAVTATHRLLVTTVADEWQLPEPARDALAGCEAYRAGAAQRPASILRLAIAYANREGFFVRKTDAEAADMLVVQGRSLLNVHDKQEARLLHALKERVHILTK